MTSQFQRLVWKEYRAQRMLWLVLVICMLLMQMIAFWSEIGAGGESGGLSLVFVISLCFCVTSSAIGFAGEEEHGTAVWLRQLPVSTLTLFLSRLTATLVGTIAVVAVGALSLTAFSLFGGAKLAVMVHDGDVLYVLCGLALSLLLASLFCSLQTRSVFASMGLSVVSVVAFLMSQESLHNSNPFVSKITWLAIGLLCLSFFPLAKRWHKGPRNRIARLRVLKTFGSKLCGLMGSQSSQTGQQRGFPGPVKRYAQMVGIYMLVPSLIAVLVVALATGLHYAWPFGVGLMIGCGWLLRVAWKRSARIPSSWSNWLARAATTPTQLGRTSAVLFWRECRLAIPAGCLAIVVGLAAVVTRVFYLNGPWPGFVLLVVAVEFGLRTFRHDQQKLHGLFWSHRGVSPLLVIGIRNVVWLSILVMVGLTFLVMDLPTNLTSGHSVRIVDFVMDGAKTYDPLFVRLWFYPFTWLVGSFFIGQLSSCWIRKPLIAFFVAGGAFFAFTIGLYEFHELNIPLVITAWPIILLMAVGLVLSRRQWMDRRMSLSIGIQRAAFVLISLCCLWPAKAAWRMMEIPRHSAAAIPDEMVAESTWERIGYSQENQQSVWSKNWDDLKTWAKSTDAIEALHEMVTKNDDVHLPPMLKQPWSYYPAETLTSAVIWKADELHQSGDPNAALQHMDKGLTLLRFLQNEATSWAQWHISMRLEQQLLHHVHRVAADDRLTEQQLNRVASSIVELLKNPVSTWTLLENREVVYSQLLNRSGLLWDAHIGFYEPQRVKFEGRYPFDLVNASYDERSRFLSLMSQSDAWTMQQVPVEHTLNGEVIPSSPSGQPPNARDIERWASTTHWKATDLWNDPVFNAAGLKNVWCGTNRVFRLNAEARRLLNAERATWVIINMQRYRRQHGEFPENLETLLNDDSVETVANEYQAFIDVEAKVPFQYASDGLGYDFSVSSGVNTTLVTAKQPVLWCSTAIPRNRRVSVNMFGGIESLLKMSNRAVLPNPNRIVWIEESRELPPHGGMGFWQLKPDSNVIEVLSNEPAEDGFGAIGEDDGI